MTEETLTVRPEVLRASASALGDDAYRLAHGLTGVPGLVIPAPQWSTGAALAALEAAVHGWFGGVAGSVAAAGGAVRAAGDAYEAVDDRAVRRFTGLPR